ncbi:MAG: hypothetical protein V2A66_02400 [Pseudomonadota bacterium]
MVKNPKDRQGSKKSKARKAVKLPVRGKKGAVGKAKGAASPKKVVKGKGPRLATKAGRELREVAASVSACLTETGHDPILTGSACAAIYGGKSIKPQSIEFVIKDYAVDAVNVAMEKLGFVARSDHSFIKKDCPFEIVLVPAPVVAGDDVVSIFDAVRTAAGSIRLLNPTDCVRQRLSAFYRWGDREALLEALRVSRRHKVDMDLIRRWSDWEWAADGFEEFTKSL